MMPPLQGHYCLIRIGNHDVALEGCIPSCNPVKCVVEDVRVDRGMGAILQQEVRLRIIGVIDLDEWKTKKLNPCARCGCEIPTGKHLYGKPVPRTNELPRLCIDCYCTVYQVTSLEV
jgi:hypothetical protein